MADKEQTPGERASFLIGEITTLTDNVKEIIKDEIKLARARGEQEIKLAARKEELRKLVMGITNEPEQPKGFDFGGTHYAGLDPRYGT
jgi:hypothetical protein